MKIEKISETQIKFILTRSDLEERDISPSELTLGSDKIHRFFQDMMRLASDECAFESENTPLMVEAVSMDADVIVVVVTKITELPELGQPLNMRSLLNAAARLRTALAELKEGPPEEAYELTGPPEKESVAIFSFDDLDSLAAACARLRGTYEGESRVYKHDDRYFLLLQQEEAGSAFQYDTVLYEYGRRHISNTLSKHFLVERGEVIVRDDAVEKMSLLYI